MSSREERVTDVITMSNPVIGPTAAHLYIDLPYNGLDGDKLSSYHLLRRLEAPANIVGMDETLRPASVI